MVTREIKLGFVIVVAFIMIVLNACCANAGRLGITPLAGYAIPVGITLFEANNGARSSVTQEKIFGIEIQYSTSFHDAFAFISYKYGQVETSSEQIEKHDLDFSLRSHLIGVGLGTSFDLARGKAGLRFAFERCLEEMQAEWQGDAFPAVENNENGLAIGACLSAPFSDFVHLALYYDYLIRPSNEYSGRSALQGPYKMSFSGNEHIVAVGIAVLFP